jgi:hypothetical protein
METNVSLQDLSHQAINGAPTGSDGLKNPGALLVLFERLFDGIELSPNPTHSVQ